MRNRRKKNDMDSVNGTTEDTRNEPSEEEAGGLLRLLWTKHLIRMMTIDLLGGIAGWLLTGRLWQLPECYVQRGEMIGVAVGFVTTVILTGKYGVFSEDPGDVG